MNNLKFLARLLSVDEYSKTTTIENREWTRKNLEFLLDGLVLGTHGAYYNNDKATYGLDGTYKCGLLYNVWYDSTLVNYPRPLGRE